MVVRIITDGGRCVLGHIREQNAKVVKNRREKGVEFMD